MAKEGAVEDHPWGECAWKYKGKAFAFGGEGGASFTLKSSLDKQQALLMHPAISVAPYVGRFGWVSIRVEDEDTLELAKDLIDEAYASLLSRKKAKA
jgi:predicted DNA-binding protein (MmcQ/YjbR family)